METDQTGMQPDELEELIKLVAELTAKNPKVGQQLEEEMRRQMLLVGFPTKDLNFQQQMKEEPAAHQNLVHTLILERQRQRISQQELATRMQTKQPALARMEQGHRDPKISTLQKYAASLGKRISWQLVDDDDESVEQEQAYSPSFQRNL
ncbi:MAG TPA: helix-turn-helix transcriptional regulator [Ktedonobacteraceae bacterium]